MQGRYTCIVRMLQSAALARRANEYAASIRDKHPEKFGFFASLPSLLEKELAFAYAFDTLKADGVILFTRYGSDNHYLGHPDFKDVWAELDRRAAVVLVHPTHPVDTALVSNVPQPIIRYPFETTTAALDMLLNKTVRNSPNCRIILSHAGGVLPYLIGRPASDARCFYFDTAVSGTENVMRTLEKFAKPDHILYGTDSPYADNDVVHFHTSRMDEYRFEDPTILDKINRENALKLFPRLK
ncbi:LOW QUALITY PROTEIN: hypothetical protein N5P37_002857 [Trichoderma harzianum]|nr:LOW QUALITY PROTEIN: hypothetical protein N5P37_002857 [Trichoderma harzianum]